MTAKQKQSWADTGKQEHQPYSEEGGQPLDLDSVTLPPCTAENICCKPCIISKKPYLKIHFPGGKAPEKSPSEMPEGWEWGE